MQIIGFGKKIHLYLFDYELNINLLDSPGTLIYDLLSCLSKKEDNFALYWQNFVYSYKVVRTILT